jgi:phosphoglycolate phosphatase-like HAD superfamily hydrolase
MNDFNINSQELIFFGDAESDLYAAKELNIDFVGVGDYLKNTNIRQNEKYLHINDFNELI